MPAKTSGQVLERSWKSGRGFALRVRAYGKRHYVTLGLEADGWTPERAEEELQNILADVRRAIWIPPDRNRRPDHTESPTADEPEREPTFHAFASQWLAGRSGEISPATYQAYEGALTHHLLPYFARWHLTEIDIPAVDAYRRYKVAQAEQRRRAITDGTAERDRGGKRIQPLSPVSINKTIDVLQMVLAQAVEYGHTTSNPAAGRRRRLKKPARRPIHLDSSQQIQALLDAATELDRSPLRRTSVRRATVAMLMFAGPRAEELCHLRWRDVDLANGRVHIGRSKTQAGLREITLLPILRDELATHKADSARTGPDDPVFPTSTGSLRDKDNLRMRVLAPVLHRADRRHPAQAPPHLRLHPRRLRRGPCLRHGPARAHGREVHAARLHAPHAPGPGGAGSAAGVGGGRQRGDVGSDGAVWNRHAERSSGVLVICSHCQPVRSEYRYQRFRGVPPLTSSADALARGSVRAANSTRERAQTRAARPRSRAG